MLLTEKLREDSERSKSRAALNDIADKLRLQFSSSRIEDVARSLAQ